MRTLYHEFESLEHLLASRLLPGGDDSPIRFVVFGGTGAVGGAAVMELCRMIMQARQLGRRGLRGEIYATGLGDKEISKFVSRLYLALEDEVEIEKLEPLRHYRLAGRIDLRFSVLRLQIPSDLAQEVAGMGQPDCEADLESALGEYFAARPCPFLSFVEQLEDPCLHAVVVAIPLPSVATYTLGSIDSLLDEKGLDRASGQRVKKGYLKTFIRGLAVIQQRYARHVVMAHTTAVGGMYRVDGGQAEIRLGFAHSALGKKLVDKKYFADELTQFFVDQGFDVLVTAAAIGIDAVEFRCHLPSDRAVIGRLRTRAAAAEHEAVDPEDLQAGQILLYPCRDIPLHPQSPEEGESREGGRAKAEAADTSQADEAATNEPELAFAEASEHLIEGDPQLVASAKGQASSDPGRLFFGAGKDLTLKAAIRSGENGLFSVANCVALYHVMKVAIPEELAMVLVRHAVFGPERRRDWFQEKISYYCETENSYFALRLLDSYPELIRAHHGAFAVQAYQALGSSTHQARLHELGLVMLLLRLRELGKSFREIPETTLAEAVPELDDFFWEHTRIPSFEDLDELDPQELSIELGALCEVSSMEQAGRLIGYDPRLHAMRQPGREKFLNRLATKIQRHLQVITSLGIPIIYRRRNGEDRLLIGPYVAPMDTAVAHADDLHLLVERLAKKYGTTVGAFSSWVIANNGFIDLRPHAIGSSAMEPGSDLVDGVRHMSTPEELEEWIAGLSSGSYFTTSGLLALHYRLSRLGHQVRNRKVVLGTRETWKHLFRQDRQRRHLITPGLVETVRMYNEGLGKVTGTEALWPSWGY